MFRVTIVFCFNGMTDTRFNRRPAERFRHFADDWFCVRFHHGVHSTGSVRNGKCCRKTTLLSLPHNTLIARINLIKIIAMDAIINV